MWAPKGAFYVILPFYQSAWTTIDQHLSADRISCIGSTINQHNSIDMQCNLQTRFIWLTYSYLYPIIIYHVSSQISYLRHLLLIRTTKDQNKITSSVSTPFSGYSQEKYTFWFETSLREECFLFILKNGSKRTSKGILHQITILTASSWLSSPDTISPSQLISTVNLLRVSNAPSRSSALLILSSKWLAQALMVHTDPSASTYNLTLKSL